MDDFSALAQTLEQAVAQHIAPGAALACGREDTLLFSRVLGWASLHPQPIPIQGQTLFDLASLTKVLATTLLTMKLCETERLELDAPLGQLLPALYPPDKAALSLRQILAHAAGLPAHVPFYCDRPPEPADPQAQRREVFRAVREAPLAGAPGTQSQYSDLGFILLGELLELLEGDRLDRLCETHLFAPLGLQRTFFVHLDDPLPQARLPQSAFAATEDCPWRGRVVCGQVHDENSYLLRGVAGHAGLFSTLDEVQTLARLLLRCLAGRSSFLRAQTVAAFTRRQELVPGSSRALGWDTPSTGTTCGRYFSPRAFGHTGFTGTSVWMDPEGERFVVLLSNRVHPHRDNSQFQEFRPRLHDLALESMAP
ncbi:MAG: serine hydrolase [Candidatus Latescibacteria bacterium]|nr:serine hydrolase [Candidatus Latescibacterota bacterium]